jgi:hypothetical protein
VGVACALALCGALGRVDGEVRVVCAGGLRRRRFLPRRRGLLLERRRRGGRVEGPIEMNHCYSCYEMAAFSAG